MIFVDTGYLLALLNPRDELHESAQAWADSVSESLVITEYVLWEMVNGLSMPIDRTKAHMAIEAIRSDVSWKLLSATQSLFEAGLRLHRDREDKEWSLTDCISFHVMSQRNILSALTYDHHSVGGAVSFSSGASYLTTWTDYQRTLDAAGNPDRFPISSIPLLASLPNRNANPEEFTTFVATNQSALMTMFAGYFASF